jgi:hypothetical protein
VSWFVVAVAERSVDMTTPDVPRMISWVLWITGLAQRRIQSGGTGLQEVHARRERRLMRKSRNNDSIKSTLQYKLIKKGERIHAKT